MILTDGENLILPDVNCDQHNSRFYEVSLECMKILVTGGAGFIGSNFVSRTVQTRPKARVTVLDALTYAGSKVNLSDVMSDINFVHGDIRDSDLVSRLVRDCDLVVHFAAETHNDRSLLSPMDFYDVNLTGTLRILEACRKHSRRLHHVSTDEVFGDLPLESQARFTEESPYRPSSPYSSSKAASDHAVRAWVRSFGISATISNCSNNYGPRQHQEKLIPAAIHAIKSGRAPRIYGTGENVRDWIHVDDHVDGVWSVIDKGQCGETYLLGSNDEMSNLSLIQRILELFDLPMDFIDWVDDRPGHDRRYAIDSTKARVNLGWQPKKAPLMEEIRYLIS